MEKHVPCGSCACGTTGKEIEFPRRYSNDRVTLEGPVRRNGSRVECERLVRRAGVGVHIEEQERSVRIVQCDSAVDCEVAGRRFGTQYRRTVCVTAVSIRSLDKAATARSKWCDSP